MYRTLSTPAPPATAPHHCPAATVAAQTHSRQAGYPRARCGSKEWREVRKRCTGAAGRGAAAGARGRASGASALRTAACGRSARPWWLPRAASAQRASVDPRRLRLRQLARRHTSWRRARRPGAHPRPPVPQAVDELLLRVRFARTRRQQNHGHAATRGDARRARRPDA